MSESDDRPAPRELQPEEFYPDFSRRRRTLPRQASPIGWLLPVLVFAVGMIALSRVVPDVTNTAASFGRSYVAQHESAAKKANRANPSPAVVAEAESIAARLRLRPGLAARLARAGVAPLRARIGHAFNEHQLHVLVRGSAVGTASVFQERFAPRTLTDYRRRDVDGERFYVSSAEAAKKGLRDTVIVWDEPGMLLTLVGRAPEESLLALARTVRRTKL